MIVFLVESEKINVLNNLTQYSNFYQFLLIEYFDTHLIIFSK
jgi:hypothetical protein